MADNTKIEWTEATWNPITGCSLASPGCTNCYAMKLAGTRLQHHESRKGLTRDSKAGPVWTGQTRFNEQWLTQPLKWKRPRMIFVCAHGDLFHESVPDEWIDRVFAIMALAPHHTFQVLTKRSARMREYFRESTGWRARVAGLLNDLKPSPLWNGNVYQGWQNLHGRPDGLPNVWLGASVEDQTRADERVPDLLATPAAVRWLSCEPLLGPVDLTDIDLAASEAAQLEPSGLSRLDALTGIHSDEVNGEIPGIWGDPDPRIDWIICGGESGPGARPMHPDWARSLRDQCAAADVPFFFKQWGEWAPEMEDGCGVDPDACYRDDGEPRWPGHAFKSDGTFSRIAGDGTAFLRKCGKKAAGRLLDGIEHNGMPEVARV